ncbi:MAG TPA: methionyl-tRNA formyltransferase [Cyanobacteria bacterium UBA9579]|nr:methionyl-tRNA formyltransferase [Cyanobacteria bacterium UBA9579]
MSKKIIIATPNKRSDLVISHLSSRLGDYEIIRISSKQELNLDDLQMLKPEIIFFPHWSWIIPEEIHARFKCIIFHMTDLPYGRGGSPLQNLVVLGHKETMLSALLCVSELDAGPIYLKRRLSLQGTAEEILTRASDLMEEMIVEILQNKIEPIAQEGEPFIFKRRRPEDGNIVRLDRVDKIYDYIRMLDGVGYPPAFIETEHFRVEFNDAKLTNDAVFANVKIV